MTGQERYRAFLQQEEEKEARAKAMLKLKSFEHNGRECYAVRSDFYVKRGPYTHGWIKGWELWEVGTDKIIVSGDPGQPHSSYEFQKPKHPTKRALLIWIGIIKR